MKQVHLTPRCRNNPPIDALSTGCNLLRHHRTPVTDAPGLLVNTNNGALGVAGNTLTMTRNRWFPNRRRLWLVRAQVRLQTSRDSDSRDSFCHGDKLRHNSRRQTPAVDQPRSAGSRCRLRSRGDIHGAVLDGAAIGHKARQDRGVGDLRAVVRRLDVGTVWILDDATVDTRVWNVKNHVVR